MKKNLINEVRKFKKIAGLLKEYVEASPESVLEAFEKAGIDLDQPITVVEDYEHEVGDPKVIAAELQKIKDEAPEEEGVWFDYDAPEVYSAEDYGVEGECKLAVVVSDAYEYVIFQNNELKEDLFSDLKKIEDFAYSHPSYEHFSPEELKNVINGMTQEWEATKNNYNSIEDYFEELETRGDLY